MNRKSASKLFSEIENLWSMMEKGILVFVNIESMDEKMREYKIWIEIIII